ncbi:MAG: hypothetical protein HYY30_14310 [Chloroflexi bacterium]|nr:hypothetical protein [Chloroflexota bacterium]
MRPLTSLIFLALIVTMSSQLQRPAVAEVAPEPAAQPLAANSRLGIVFIGSAEIPSLPAYRFSRATSLGAGWDRWPMYWDMIEGSNGSPDYTAQDAVVRSDIANALQVNAILVGTPSWAASPMPGLLEDAPPPRVGEGPRYFAPVPPGSLPNSFSPAAAPPAGLNEKIFTDGSDTPGPYKTINPRNYWARFVYNTVYRYKPGIRVWEMWNEPDNPSFWSGSVEQYFRLLKVGYIAAKFADPEATVLMGGLAHWTWPNQNFLSQILAAIKADNAAAANNHYFDAMAQHWYNRSSQMYDMVNQARSTLQSYGLGAKPVWVNETGVPIWNDPTRPPFGGENKAYFGSATMDEAASYVIQAIAYGLAANVQQIFAFQQYDDGNAEAFGLLRNDNTQRPSFTAYQVASQYFSNYSSVQKTTDRGVDIVTFCEPSSRKVTVAWNNSPSGRSYSITASPRAVRAYWVDKAGYATNLNLARSYTKWLPGATDNNGLTSNDYIIGGSPYILVEQYTASAQYGSAEVEPTATSTGFQLFGISPSGGSTRLYFPRVYKNYTVYTGTEC